MAKIAIFSVSKHFFLQKNILLGYLSCISAFFAIFAQKIEDMLPIHFAPLQGYTEAPYRMIHHQVCGGIESYYTPFIRLEHGQIRKKDLREALPEQNQGINLVPQVIAANAEEFNQLSRKLIEIGHRRIDINMGCPFPLQTRLGRGSGIWQHPEQVEAILSAAQKLHKEEDIEFSLKMRLGQESPNEALNLLSVLNKTSLVHITVHPRVGRQQYKGDLLMEEFDIFYKNSSNPLILNGDLLTVADLQAAEQKYPQLSGLMIGRGLLSRPTLASEYQKACQGNGIDPIKAEENARQKVLLMHRQLFDYYKQHIEGGDSQLLLKMHSFWDYQELLFGHKAVKKVLKSGSLKNYIEATANVLHN